MAVNTPARGWVSSRTLGVLVLSLMTACGGGSTPGPVDGGGDAGGDASTDDATTDSGGLCSSDDACDDGLFCNGAERCLPADPAASDDGCVPAAADACLAGQTCDEDAHLCQTMCDVSGDADGDGHDSLDCGGDDCDDTDATRFPGNAEVCDSDGHDEDCDPTTLGSDGDEDGDGHLRLECCNPQADGTNLCGDDCEDTESTINPEAIEVCDGDVDNDCNGLADSADGVCVPCPAGYRGFDASCTNIDECAEGAPCGGAVGATCADTDGSYTCTCPTGYTGAGVGAGGTCADNDECTTGTPCGSSATACTNTPGSYACTCAPGYTAPASGGTCSDVDECLVASTCGAARAGCTNTLGSYICSCTSGFDAPATGGTCGSTDQCGMGTPCGTHGTSCANTPGSYQCTCESGYRAPPTGGTCVDIDECATASTCGPARAGCTNVGGSYSCICASGYRAPATGGTCVNVDECATASTCGAGRASCLDTVGSYQCTCLAGYSAPPTGGSCVDINECTTLVPCGPGSCANSAGSYTCTCNPGYSAPATGGSCTDINECTAGTDDCDTDPVAGCSNSTGSFSCACPLDFVGTGHGAAGCLLPDASLDELVPSVGSLLWGFARDLFDYTLALPPGVTSVSFTPTVLYPTHATIRVNGSIVASGSSSAPITLTTLAVMPVSITVTTDDGTMLTYTVVVARSSAYIKASNTGANDNFGTNTNDGVTLALSSDGTTLAVGAWKESSNATGVGGNQADDGALNAGAVYVFTRSGSTWSQQAYIKASNTDVGDNFGESLSLSDDGSTLAVGAAGERSNATGVGGSQADDSATNAGAVYVFTRSGSTWSQRAYIKASNTAANDRFGRALQLSGDGATLAVSAPGEDSNATGVGGNQANNSATSAGAVYVFTGGGGTWSQQAYIKASNTDANDFFGGQLALSTNGATLVVGAEREDSNATGVGGSQTSSGAVDSGAVYIFTRSGSAWSQQAYIKASNTDAGDRFGRFVSLSGTGSTLAVGAWKEDSSATGVGGSQTSGGAVDSGAVYVFTRSGSTWSQQAYIKASNTDTGDMFGAVALSDDGSTLLVGASSEDSDATGIDGNQGDNSVTKAGAVYVFARSGSTWSQLAYLKSSNTDSSDEFGRVGAISGDASTIALGAFEDSSATGIGGNQADNSISRSGAVYVF